MYLYISQRKFIFLKNRYGIRQQTSCKFKKSHVMEMCIKEISRWGGSSKRQVFTPGEVEAPREVVTCMLWLMELLSKSL